MAKHLLSALIGIIALVGICALVSAELPPANVKAAEACIKDFSSKDFEVRQKAVQTLIAMGKDVVPMVKKALAETDDAEVKLRCQMVLKGLGVMETPGAVVAPGKFGTDASKVTIKQKDAQLDEILQAFADQSGNARLETPKDWDGQQIDFQVSDMLYWQALDKLCVQAHLIYAVDFQTGTLKLSVTKDLGELINAYSGPVVVKAESATLTKIYRQSPMYGRAAGLMINLSYFYEDRLQPVDVEADVTKITAPDGAELKLLDMQGGPQNQGRGRGGRGFRGFGGNQGPSGYIFAMVTEVPKNVDTLKTVEGVVKLTFGAGSKTIKIPNGFKEGQSATVGNVTVTVTKVDRQDDEATVTLTITEDGKPADMPAFGAKTAYGVRLIDPNGKTYSPSGSGPAAMFMNMGGGRANVRVQAGGGQAAGGVVVIGNGNPAEGGVTAFFRRLPDVKGEWTIEFIMPETMTVKECKFVMNDVPLR